MQFSIPNGSGDNFQRNALMEKPPETLREALGTKGAAKTIDNAMNNANPYYSTSYSEYSENCQRCVVAYELMGRWRGAFRHAKTDRVGVAGNNSRAEAKVLDNISAKMKEYGNGSRAIIRIGYRGAHVGHVFNVENRGGHMYFIDAQTGQRYINADMRNLMKIVDTKSVSVTRTDNLQISNRAKEFVWQRNRNK